MDDARPAVPPGEIPGPAADATSRAPAANSDAPALGSSVRRAMSLALLLAARLLTGAGSLLSHLAAGLLRPADLRRALLRRWEDFGLRDPAGTIEGLMPWEREFYGRFLRPGDRVLVVGCGAGRDLVALVQQGHRAEGLEPVPRCAEAARENLRRRGLSAPVATAWIETAPLEGPYDAFVLSWECYSYIVGSGARVAVLERLRRSLGPGGRILLSYAAAQSPTRPLLAAAARLGGAGCRLEPGDRFFAVGGGRFLHFQHEFRLGEIAEEAGRAGLKVAHEDRTCEPIAVLVPAP